MGNNAYFMNILLNSKIDEFGLGWERSFMASAHSKIILGV